MHDMIKRIIQEKRKQLRNTRSKVFIDALCKVGLTVIGEIKLASPTNPAIGTLEDIEKKVKAYETAGVDALSIVTEKNFFKGNITLISRVKQMTLLPILQKDFVIDEQQIYEARFLGSDALLFIARILSQKKLQKFVALSKKLGIEPVVEVVNKKDLEIAVSTTTEMIAVNARDLDTFEVDVDKAATLMKQIPKEFIKLGFSGIVSANEVDIFKKAGAEGVLIGTSLMKTNNETEFLRSLHI